MLSIHLANSLQDLRDIIEITKLDIKDIKEAQNETQFKRLEQKEQKLRSFENNKAMIDAEIVTLVSNNPDTPLPQLLNEEQHSALEEFKVLLAQLHEINKQYAKYVIIVSNVYNNFLETLIPTEMMGYNKVAAKVSTIFEARA